MSAAEQRAAQARILMQDQTFRDVMDEIKKDATTVFLNTASGLEAIAAAHEKVRAVGIVIAALEGRITDATFEQKKGQHLGRD